MVSNGYKRENVPPEYLKAKKAIKKTGDTVPEQGLDWTYVFDNDMLNGVTKTASNSSFYFLLNQIYK